MFSFAHLSDIHLAPVPPAAFRQLCGKRVLGYLSWHRKRKSRHRPEILQALQRDLAICTPDHICVTGDLVNIALPGEFAASRTWLDRLGARETVSVIPGNHDAYVREGGRLSREAWADWMGPDIPYVHKRGPAAFIGLSTAVATPPFMASGRLGAVQLDWLDRTLMDLAGSGLARIVMLHHPPQPHAAVWRKSLRDAEAFRAVIARRGADLVLHGHLHHAVRAELEGPDGPVPVFGAGSASYVKGQYWLFRLEDRQINAQSRLYDKLSCNFKGDGSESLTIGAGGL